MQRGRPPLGKITITTIYETKTFHFYQAKSLTCNTAVEATHHTTTPLNSTTFRSNLSSGEPKKALAHFLQSKKHGVALDRFAIPSLLKLSLLLNEPPIHGEHIHAFVIKSGYIYDPFIATGLSDAYFKYGYFDAAHNLFDEISERDVVLFTAMICGFSRNGLVDEALGFFFAMLKEGIKPNRITVASVLSVSSQLGKLSLGKILHGSSLRSCLLDNMDVVLQTALVDMYAKCGRLGYAKRVFDKMSERNLVSWSSIINSYFSGGLFQIALELFRDMVSECWQRPRSSTLASVLNVCGVTTDLRKGKEVHGFILKCINNISELDSLVECNAIIDMYVKTGNLQSAILLFEFMLNRNIVTWTTMISGYGANGFGGKALHAFNEMKESGIRPDGVAFVSILSACSHGGLVDEGQKLYFSMQRDYNVAPEMKHFVCMVDLYGRAGRLKEAFDFIKTMPAEPSKFVWGALLSCCRNHKNLEMGEYAGKKAIELDHHDVGNYVLLARLYADVGRWEDVAKVRLIMKDLGLRPDTACSWVEVKGKVYRFTVGDHFKSFSRRIYGLLEKLGLIMEKAGFRPDTSSVGRNVDEEEKVIDLCCHTEKLALAFVLMKDGGVGVIRIWKNLRVCRDCHEAFKYISMICNREIILKDPNRYHRFGVGCCSCHDYW